MRKLLTLGVIVLASPIIAASALLLWVALTLEPVAAPLEDDTDASVAE